MHWIVVKIACMTFGCTGRSGDLAAMQQALSDLYEKGFLRYCNDRQLDAAVTNCYWNAATQAGSLKMLNFLDDHPV